VYTVMSADTDTHQDYRHYPTEYVDHHHHAPAHQKVITRVRYVDEPKRTRVRVITKKRKRPVVRVVHEEPGLIPVVAPGPAVVHQPVAPVHPVSGFEGSYVAVAGNPSRGSIHVVENVPALGADSVTVVNGVRVRNRAVGVAIGSAPAVVVPPPVAARAPVVAQAIPVTDFVPGPRFDPRLGAAGFGANRNSSAFGVNGDRLPLPKCSYVNTDFPGDNLLFDDGNTRGLNAGSARGCKALCRLEVDCSFWTYREGFNRNLAETDCFLKVGTPGLPVPREAVPRIGFVSGTKDNNCVCITSDDEEDEVCPLKDPKGVVYPWRSTDQEEDDLARGLPISGWRRRGDNPLDPYSTFFPGYDFAGAGGAGGGSLGDDLRSLRAQLDVLTRRIEQAG